MAACKPARALYPSASGVPQALRLQAPHASVPPQQERPGLGAAAATAAGLARTGAPDSAPAAAGNAAATQHQPSLETGQQPGAAATAQAAQQQLAKAGGAAAASGQPSRAPAAAAQAQRPGQHAEQPSQARPRLPGPQAVPAPAAQVAGPVLGSTKKACPREHPQQQAPPAPAARQAPAERPTQPAAGPSARQQPAEGCAAAAAPAAAPPSSARPVPAGNERLPDPLAHLELAEAHISAPQQPSPEQPAACVQPAVQAGPGAEAAALEASEPESEQGEDRPPAEDPAPISAAAVRAWLARPAQDKLGPPPPRSVCCSEQGRMHRPRGHELLHCTCSTRSPGHSQMERDILKVGCAGRRRPLLP